MADELPGQPPHLPPREPGQPRGVRQQRQARTRTPEGSAATLLDLAVLRPTPGPIHPVSLICLVEATARPDFSLFLQQTTIANYLVKTLNQRYPWRSEPPLGGAFFIGSGETVLERFADFISYVLIGEPPGTSQLSYVRDDAGVWWHGYGFTEPVAEEG